MARSADTAVGLHFGLSEKVSSMLAKQFVPFPGTDRSLFFPTPQRFPLGLIWLRQPGTNEPSLSRLFSAGRRRGGVAVEKDRRKEEWNN